MILLAAIVVIVGLIIVGLIFGCLLDLIVDVVIALIGAELLGGWLLATFLFDCKVALLVIFFVLLRLIKTKLKGGKK